MGSGTLLGIGIGAATLLLMLRTGQRVASMVRSRTWKGTVVLWAMMLGSVMGLGVVVVSVAGFVPAQLKRMIAWTVIGFFPAVGVEAYLRLRGITRIVVCFFLAVCFAEAIAQQVWGLSVMDRASAGLYGVLVR